jgi:hypothetical protein
MGRGIKHFMWGYQLHFRIRQEGRARSLFALLDNRFQPEVFLVGIRIENCADKHPACVEPEDDFWIQSEAFDDVISQAKKIVPTYPESQIRQSHPLAQKWQDDGLLKRGVRDAIVQVIAECPYKPEGMRYFPSWPVVLEGFLVSLVVGLQESVIRSHASLKSDRIKIHEYRSFKLPTSVIEAVTDEYLGDATSELLMPDPGADPTSGKSRAEILRAAGKRMITSVAQRADTFDNQEGCEESLFDVCNTLSSQKYEGATSVGRLILARKDHAAVRTQTAFAAPIPVGSARAMRKLLELSRLDLALHMNARDAFGLAKIGDYATEQEDLYEISILDRHLWELAHAGQALMRVHDGLPSLPAPLFDASRLRRDLRRIFPYLADAQSNLLVELVGEAAKEKHGTMLVISEEAVAEADRLANQATLVEPCTLTPELLRQLTPIDGAVLLDPAGTCRAIGVILDGMATEKGNPARGARFNSAIRYVESQKKACMAIVVSEDGGVDLVPELRPPIPRSEIERAIAELGRLLETDRINRRRFRRLTDWFGEVRFYLLPEHCEALNRLIALIDARVIQQDPEAPQIVRHEFVAAPDFDPNLYYAKENP